MLGLSCFEGVTITQIVSCVGPELNYACVLLSTRHYSKPSVICLRLINQLLANVIAFPSDRTLIFASVPESGHLGNML